MKRPITPRGYAKLRTELKALKVMRPELARAIETARGHGDISENADYDAAKEKSGLVEAKIRDLEMRLAEADIVDPRKLGNPSRVMFGVTVTIEDVDSGEQRTVSIYGPDESDVDRGFISFESPLGKGLIGKEVGDVAQIQLPGGRRSYEVVEISVDYSDGGEIPGDEGDEG